MIYIDSNSQKMTILKSKQNKIIDAIKLVNQTDKNEIIVNISDDQIEYNKNTIELQTINIIDSLHITGHYDYYLMSNSEIVESGILQFNDFEPEIKSYEIENKNTIQYNG